MVFDSLVTLPRRREAAKVLLTSLDARLSLPSPYRSTLVQYFYNAISIFFAPLISRNHLYLGRN